MADRLDLCGVADAADWLDPGFLTIVRDELEETPRPHRKQWEFAAIFRALDRCGCLGAGKVGLSMGSGRERLMYAVARRVERLTATDLYSPTSPWSTARVADERAAVLAAAPFPIDERRLAVERMDMRALQCADSSFDFCYSSCAVEHIGGEDALVQHLLEAHRVLRPGGVYAFTTEFHFGPELVDDPGNPLFPADWLARVVARTPLSPEGPVRAAVSPHPQNLPWPANLLTAYRLDAVGRALAAEAPHIQLLRGPHVFTSVLLVLRKLPPDRAAVRLEWRGVDTSRAWFEAPVARYRAAIETGHVELDPFAFLGDEPASDAETPPGPPDERVTRMHTDYVWYGRGRRRFTVEARGISRQPSSSAELRVHRQTLLDGASVSTAAEAVVRTDDRLLWSIVLDVDEGAAYAVLGRTPRSSPGWEDVRVWSAPA